MSRNPLLVSIPILLLASGCRNSEDQIRTYRVSKESSSGSPVAAAPATGSNAGPEMGRGTAPSGNDMTAMGADMGMQAAASAKEVEWKLPAGWREQPASSIRVGSFLAKGSNGQEADISVIPLSGEAGGDLSNINRWRGQINLEPITEAELPRISETIQAGGRTMLLVDIVSKELLVDNKFPKRILAATYKQGSRTWFFKMVGDDTTVQEAKPAFVQFLKSLKFHAHE